MSSTPNTDLPCRVVQNPDGTTESKPVNHRVMYENITVTESRSTFIRLFLPCSAVTAEKLPLLVHFDSQFFWHCSPDIHNFCETMARGLNALVASVYTSGSFLNMRMSQYDISLEALRFIHSSGGGCDDWLTNHADLSRIFLMGTGVGAKVACNVGLRIAASPSLKIRGLVLHHSFLGGVTLETRHENDNNLPLRTIEFWNPTEGDGPAMFEAIARLKWKVMVIGYEGDTHIDRQRDLVGVMTSRGVDVVVHSTRVGFNAFELFDPSEVKSTFALMTNFIK